MEHSTSRRDLALGGTEFDSAGLAPGLLVGEVLAGGLADSDRRRSTSWAASVWRKKNTSLKYPTSSIRPPFFRKKEAV